MRSGFTIIELLVSIAIIGILVGVLLPGIQSVRESARRLQCHSNLHQISLAVQIYHDQQKYYPISIGPWEDGPSPSAQRNGISWIVGVLPQLEQSALYEQLSPGFQGNFFDGDGIRNTLIRSVLTTGVATLGCPSDPSSQSITRSHPEMRGIPLRTTNYKGVLGDSRIGGAESQFEGTEPDCHRIGGCNGLFFRVSYQQPLGTRDISDGNSQTYLLGEDVPEHNARSAAFYANGDHASCHAPPNYFPSPPNPEHWQDVTSFRSRHRQGLNFAFADGSVRFVSQEIDRQVYRSHSTRNGREVIAQ